MGQGRGTAVAAALLLAFSPAGAQQSEESVLLPGVRWFEGGLADPDEPRISGALLRTDLLAGRGPERPPFSLADAAEAEREVQAAVTIGATIPLLQVARWEGGGVVLAGQGGVSARFRIERRSRDDLGQDWLIALPVEVRLADVSGRVRIGHRSAHLGDEFVAETDARRIEYGHEFLELVVARDLPELGGRLYGGGAWIFRSNTHAEPVLLDADRSDRGVFQAGVEVSAFVGGPVRLVAGLDWQAAERTAWRSRFAAAAGTSFERGMRHVRILARFYDGRSAMGQFFATPERYWGIEGVIQP